MPETASSRAGAEVLEGLYSALLDDTSAHVIWHPAPIEPRHLGGFAAGSTQMRATEAKVRRSLGPSLFARLALRVAAMPRHVLARRRWESIIPQAGIGYVLTLGVARAVAPSAAPLSGRQILSELEGWFASQRCSEAWVDTELSNRRAHAFYLRSGYSEVSRDLGQVLLKKPLG